MIYGVKFCGGCNPRYERGKALKTIREHFKEKMAFEIAQEGRNYEGLLIIGGCPNCCPDYKHFNAKRHPLKLYDENQINKVIKELEKEAD
jgi:hypothetical protein